MANTYTQIYIHVVFAVKERENLIHAVWKDELHKYIAGTITNKGHKSLIVNGMPDHVHALIGLNLTTALSDLVRDIKNNSANFVNTRKLSDGHFAWQEGYGAFSYSRSQLDSVYQYILKQEEHHSQKTFKAEYLALLKKFDVQYDPKYVFKWITGE